MNERIKELIEQAEEYAFDELNKLQGPVEMSISRRVFEQSFREKFAELIVRECIDTAFHRGHPDLEFLLKHFGVEESGINQQLRNRSTYFGNNP